METNSGDPLKFQIFRLPQRFCGYACSGSGTHANVHACVAPCAAATRTSSEQLALAFETDPACRFVLSALAFSPYMLAHRAHRMILLLAVGFVLLPVGALALRAAVSRVHAPRADRSGTGCAAVCTQHRRLGRARRLRSGGLGNTPGLESLGALLTYSKPLSLEK